jgi:hypothetical protein
MFRPSILARALLLAVLALAPLLAMTTGQGITPGYASADAIPVAPDAVRAVPHPDSVFTMDSSAAQLAQQIAKANWGVDPCGGQVTYEWGPLDADVNAQSSWTNPTSAYDNPDLNGSCKITFNPTAEFDWQKFCTVMVHELGHLAGKPHSANQADVMAAYYTVPLQACVAATPIEFKPAPKSVAKAPSASAASVRAAKTTKTVRKAAKRKAARKHRVVKKHRRVARKHRTR